MNNSIIHNLIWTQGRRSLLFCLFLGILGYYLHWLFYLISGVVVLFCFWFFRNPERTCPDALKDPLVLVCPADGKVVDIQQAAGAFDGFDQKVSIFLSPFDVHVQWIPMQGTIEQITYKRGEFVPAYVPKSSQLNERNDIIITNDSQKILIRQIAGTIARKIVCWVKTSDPVFEGQKYGMIKFGSRVDMLLPKNVALAVVMNQRVYGGQTVIGRWQY